MAGPKTNEGATSVGERTGTRAQARFVRTSAYKAREVLDLIRGMDVEEAQGVLRFTERGVADVVGKVLASAIANAQHNDSQDPAELKVVACFADEGPTLRRFRPRARGRATRIRKRTCHITIIVARMTEVELDHKRRLEDTAGAGRGRGAAASRRARVAKSRERAAATRARSKAPTDQPEALDETVEDEPLDLDETVEDTVEETLEDEPVAEPDEDESDEDEPVADTVEDEAPEPAASDTEGEK
jgi:large subunit ribosomal protein L22